MPVTFKVASHVAAPLGTGVRSRSDSVQDLLRSACPEQSRQCAALLQSSISVDELPSLRPQSNGFVRTVLQAYNTHQHLTIRPDDVWIAILSQLSHYTNAHQEELRHLFAERKDRQCLSVVAEGSRYTVDFASMTRQMTSQLHQHISDQTLTRWILPDFTTTTLVDTTICSVMMMSSLSSYFEFEMVCACGIPTVTLEGEKADWQKLLDRTERLDSFGDDPRLWATMLRPILRRFITAFEGNPDIEFWEHVAHYDPQFYGKDDLSGWITAFCVWSNKGKWQAGYKIEDISTRDSALSILGEDHDRCLVLDDVQYPQMSVLFIPDGFCEAEVELDDDGTELDCMMVAGHVAMAVTAEMNSGELNTVSPCPQWMIFLKEPQQSVQGPDVIIWSDAENDAAPSPAQTEQTTGKKRGSAAARRRRLRGTCVIS